MRKIPPVPVPPGEKFCFICETCLPVGAFPMRKGKPTSPCKVCASKSHERTAAMNALIEEVRREVQEVMARVAARTGPPPPSFPDLDLPPAYVGIWERRKAAMQKAYEDSLKPPKETEYVPYRYR